MELKPEIVALREKTIEKKNKKVVDGWMTRLMDGWLDD